MNKLLKEAQILLRTAFQFDLPPPLHRRIEHFLTRTKEKPGFKKKAAKLRQRSEKQSARASHNQETAKIREEVMKRAGLCCEACGFMWVMPPLQMDHWLGGLGRRRQRQSVATCWALCPPCHSDRTFCRPSSAHWNERFAVHAAKYGYPALPHIIHAEPAKAGGAP